MCGRASGSWALTVFDAGPHDDKHLTGLGASCDVVWGPMITTGLATNRPLSGQLISNQAVIRNSCRNGKLTSLSRRLAPSQFAEKVLEGDDMAFPHGNFRGFHR
jgi:hypothetical protein